MDSIIKLRMTTKEFNRYIKKSQENNSVNIFDFCNKEIIKKVLCESVLIFELERILHEKENYLQKIIIPKTLFFSLPWKNIKKWLKTYFKRIIFEYYEYDLKKDLTFNITFIKESSLKNEEVKILITDTIYENLDENNNWFFKNFKIFQMRKSEDFDDYFRRQINEINDELINRINSKNISEYLSKIKKFIYYREEIQEIISEYRYLTRYFKIVINDISLYKPIYSYHMYPDKKHVLEHFEFDKKNNENKIMVMKSYEEATKIGKSMLVDDDCYGILTILPLENNTVKFYLEGNEIDIGEYKLTDFIIKK